MASKYGNKKVKLEGYVFDSKAEAGRYLELKLLLKLDRISFLRVHPKFEVLKGFEKHGHKYRPITYTADFEYYDKDINKLIVEDVKGYKTDVYKLKKKLFIFSHPEYTFIES